MFQREDGVRLEVTQNQKMRGVFVLLVATNSLCRYDIINSSSLIDLIKCVSIFAYQQLQVLAFFKNQIN